jgi:hypothetical protein
MKKSQSILAEKDIIFIEKYCELGSATEAYIATLEALGEKECTRGSAGVSGHHYAKRLAKEIDEKIKEKFYTNEEKKLDVLQNIIDKKAVIAEKKDVLTANVEIGEIPELKLKTRADVFQTNEWLLKTLLKKAESSFDEHVKYKYYELAQKIITGDFHKNFTNVSEILKELQEEMQKNEEINNENDNENKP